MTEIVKIVNITPHAITVRSPSGEDVTFPASGAVARIASTTPEGRALVGGVPVAPPLEWGGVEGLPAPAQGTVYIVSGLVGTQCPRHDVFVPGTSPSDEPFRNERGHVVAVRHLRRTV